MGKNKMQDLVVIIEDAAELIGGSLRGHPCGNLPGATLSTFSFYPNKHVTTGEGGMVFTDDPFLASRVRELRNLCFSSSKPRFVHEELGFNYRMTSLQAALGSVQLQHLDEAVALKRVLGSMYNKMFREKATARTLKWIRLPREKAGDCENIFWVYMVEVLHPSVTASDVMRELGKVKVGTRPCFYPIHKQPVFVGEATEATETDTKTAETAAGGGGGSGCRYGKYERFRKTLKLTDNRGFPLSYGNCERLSEKSFYLPSGMVTSEDDISEIVDRVLTVCNELF